MSEQKFETSVTYRDLLKARYDEYLSNLEFHHGNTNAGKSLKRSLEKFREVLNLTAREKVVNSLPVDKLVVTKNSVYDVIESLNERYTSGSQPEPTFTEFSDSFIAIYSSYIDQFETITENALNLFQDLSDQKIFHYITLVKNLEETTLATAVTDLESKLRRREDYIDCLIDEKKALEKTIKKLEDRIEEKEVDKLEEKLKSLKLKVQNEIEKQMRPVKYKLTHVQNRVFALEGSNADMGIATSKLRKNSNPNQQMDQLGNSSSEILTDLGKPEISFSPTAKRVSFVRKHPSIKLQRQGLVWCRYCRKTGRHIARKCFFRY